MKRVHFVKRKKNDYARHYPSDYSIYLILATNPTCDLGKRNSRSLIHKNTILSQKVPDRTEMPCSICLQTSRKMLTLDDNNFRGYFSRSIFDKCIDQSN